MFLDYFNILILKIIFFIKKNDNTLLVNYYYSMLKLDIFFFINYKTTRLVRQVFQTRIEVKSEIGLPKVKVLNSSTSWTDEPILIENVDFIMTVVFKDVVLVKIKIINPKIIVLNYKKNNEKTLIFF
jgi:hypothetical protein